MPVYERFTPKTVFSVTITPEFLTMENVNQLGLSQRRIAIKLLLNGTTGDPAAWAKLCEHSPLDEYEKRQVIADSLTQVDIDFLKSLPNREQLSLELKSPEKRDFELLKELSLGVLSVIAMDRDPDAASALSDLKSIQFWRFEKCQLGESMESFLASMPAPKMFSAYQCVLTPAAMAAVASHTSLEQVGILPVQFRRCGSEAIRAKCQY